MVALAPQESANEAPHFCDASCVSDVLDGLTRSDRSTPSRAPQRRVGRRGWSARESNPHAGGK